MSFINACVSGNLEVNRIRKASTITNKSVIISVSLTLLMNSVRFIPGERNRPFESACETGNLTEAKRIHGASTIAIESLHLSFMIALQNGHLLVAQWLYIELNSIFCNNYAKSYVPYGYMADFIKACCKGHLSIAQWLFQIMPINNQFEYCTSKSFYYAGCNGHLHVVQWLLEINPALDISETNDVVFHYVCQHNHVLVAQWLLKKLLEKKPYYYEIKIMDDGTMKGIVRTKEEAKEARWQHIKYAVWAASDASPNHKSILYRLPPDVSKLVFQFV